MEMVDTHIHKTPIHFSRLNPDQPMAVEVYLESIIGTALIALQSLKDEV